MNLDSPHRRFNPLTRDWVLVSPHRAKRPWQGQVEKLAGEALPPYDPACYLCPGNERAGGVHNLPYENVYVFDNDFAALLPGQQETSGAGHPLFVAEPESGLCRVLCFSPRHDLTLPQLPQSAVEAVIAAWTEQTVELGRREGIRYVQVFENKGAMMGCANPHPHSQIWATGCIPNEPARELASQADYLRERGSCLLCDYLAAEQKDSSRVVCANEHFTALVPFWAIWPFEILLLAHRHAASLADLEPGERAALADVIRRLTARYDNLFEISFPYSMGFHQAPTDGGDYPGQHLHAHFYPPLLRSATVRKFMVGYEMLSMPQRDITPETAAERLRGLSEVHYLANG